MSDVGLADELEPLPGVEAFESELPSALASRAAQYLGMATYAFGSPAAAAALQDEGDELAIPQLAAAGEEVDSVRYAQERLDESTDIALADRGLPGFDGGPGSSETASLLWQEVDGTRRPEVLVALLNLRQRAGGVEGAAAAAALLGLSRGELRVSAELLSAAAGSSDELERGIALAALGPEPVPGPAPVPGPGPTAPVPLGASVSTTIHGTWGLVADDDGWYVPGSPMHDFLRDRVRDDLYDSRPDYFMWNGGYSDADRGQGAADLPVWTRRVSPQNDRLDTVFAHSHGGNVALSAAAAGQGIRLLVLLHTPAIERPDAEWAAIRAKVGGVVVMRTRLDLVVLADGTRHWTSRLKFDPQKLPHFPVMVHWRRREGYFDHSYFVKRENWERYNLPDIVQSRRLYAV
ncbi:hypothetical protein [Leifsonia sp. P73]|uniref:hypothetical protein n=1 Tax=Leifsonia sp. P73 TaxID=3423959 RepID=UPI003DA2BA55